MKEHQKCKEKNYFSLEKDMLLKLQQRKLKKNKSKSLKKILSNVNRATETLTRVKQMI
jgi:hypothetical protein